MPRNTFPALFAILAISGSVYCAYLSRPSTNAGLIAVEPVRHFGTVRQGATIDVTFVLTNRHTGPVTVLDANGDCPCSKPTVSQKKLAPGETATVKAEWDVKGQRGPIAYRVGVLHQRDDGPIEGLGLLARAEVSPDLFWQPERLTFSPSHNKEVVYFHNLNQSAVAARKVYTTHRAFEARLAENWSSATVHFDPSQWAEDQSGVALVVETTSHHEPVIRIPLTVAASNP